MVIVYLNRDCLYSIIHCMLWQMVPRDSFFKLGKEFISFGSEVIILLSFIMMEGTQEESLYDFEFGWLEGASILLLPISLSSLYLNLKILCSI